MAYIIYPYYNNFILNFYLPTDVPQSVVENHENSELTENKITFLPSAEERIDRGKKIANLKWNTNKVSPRVGKSVGEIYTYATNKDTTFQYEGNSPIVSYYYRFLQNMIDQGKTRQIGRLLTGIYSDELIYQKGFSTFEEVEEYNKVILDHQHDLKRLGSSDYSDFYKNKSAQLGHIDYNQYLIANNKGLHKLSLYQNSDQLNFTKQNIVFTDQTPIDLGVMDKANLIYDFAEIKETYLSSLPEKYRVRSFDFINTSLPFLKWSKSSIYKHEWNWFMESLGFNRRDYPVEQFGGIVTTFSSARLNVKSYDLAQLTGRKYKNLNDLASEDGNFIVSQSDKLQVEVFPDKETKNTSVLGSLSPERKDFIWRVAKTKKIPVSESNPYSVITSISGSYAKSVHIKIYFLDINGKEIGVSYVSRPEKTSYFNRVSFKTFFVTPKDAEFIQVGILSDKDAKNKIFWWLHQFDIFDLKDYKEKNNILVSKKVDPGIAYKAYLRTFHSPKGGILKIDYLGNGLTTEVNTKNDLIAQFTWNDLGEVSFKQDKVKIEIDNISGFNSISDLVLIPKDEEERLSQKIINNIKRSPRIMTLEPELDLTAEDTLQSDRNYPSFSGGLTTAILHNDLSKTIDITNDRKFSPNLHGINISSDVVIKVSTNSSELILKPIQSKVKAIEHLYTEKSPHTGHHEVFEMKEPLRIEKVQFEELILKPGQYNLQIISKKELSSLARYKEIKPLYTYIRPIENDEEGDKSCCECLYTDPLIETSSTDYKQWTTYTRNTCQWHILQSKVVKVKTDFEYIIDYKFMNHLNNKTHQKIIFMNDENVEVGKKYIDQTDNDIQERWLRKNLLIKPPKEATKMMVLFLFKGTKLENSKLSIKDLEIYNHTQLPHIDFVEFLNDEVMVVNKKRDTEKLSLSSMQKTYRVENDKLANTVTLDQTHHKIWSAYVNGRRDKPFLVNGLFQSHVFNQKSGQVELEIKIRYIYWVGLLIQIIFFVVVIFSFVSAPSESK
ncbi:MAG: hypothetical protein HRT44_00375 [Bdellovibrionales bacterium]|nr:hypothetical protein [Bdellovibrionales bacterium]